MNDRASVLADILGDLGKVVVALGPYSKTCVVIGGVVPSIYRAMKSYRAPPLPQVATTEIDLAVPLSLPTQAGETLRNRLLRGGLVAVEGPPTIRRTPGPTYFQDARYGTDKRAPRYVEVLAPLHGKRDVSIVMPQGDVRAQALKYLDLLLFEPLVVNALDVPALGVKRRTEFRVPNPAMYIVQKVRAREAGRQRAKLEKDLAYIYETVVTTEPAWDDFPRILASARGVSSAWRN